MKLSLSLLLSLLYLLPSTFASNASFTPETMLSAPRRGTALPNADGTLALYTTTIWNFTTHERSYALSVMYLGSGETREVSNSSAVGNAQWLGNGTCVIWVVSEDEGGSRVEVVDVGEGKSGESPLIAGTIPGPIDGVKTTELGDGKWGLAFFGTAARNGSLYNSELAEEPISSGRMYTKIFVRHWDTYLTPQRNSIWYTTLTSSSNGTVGYTLGEPINALNGTGLESPIPPSGGTDHFDINPTGLVFIAKDPTLNQATTTKSDVYYLPLTTFTEPAPKPQIITTPGLEGASASVAFSPVSPSIVFSRMKDISYESDKNRLLLVPDVTKSLQASEFYSTPDGVGSWDRSASATFWSADGKTLYVQVEDFARVRLFSVAADASTTEYPKLIVAEGGVSDVHALDDGKLLVSSSSFLDNSIYTLVDPVLAASSNATSGSTLISTNLGLGAPWGLSRSQISEIWYAGSETPVHAWVIKPSFYKEGETYPLMFYIHGGPQGATEDVWSTRWNMLVFAEQGYVVVAFNPTGSTGFGQSLTDGIQNQWGGRPYLDLVAGFEYIESHLPFIDTDRAVALGASYGGYMTYWIQGQALGRRFKAIFTHDGSFNTLAQYASEELWFMQHDFNGTLWDDYANYERWNPAAHTANWSTPHLIVHNELDYRLPVAEGLAAFNVLQAKGVESKFLSFSDENHWVLRPENSMVWHKAVLDWLGSYVGLEGWTGSEGTEVYDATLMNGPLI